MDAVLSSVPELDPVDRRTLPGDALLFGAFAGRYEIARGITLAITHEQGRLWAEADGKSAVHVFGLKRK